MTKKLRDFVAAARAGVQDIAPDALAEAIEQGEDWLILDVREPYEYEKMHIEGSVLVPRGLLEAAADASTPHRVDALLQAGERNIAVLCMTGGRASLAAQTLGEMGFSKVRVLAGGIKNWAAEDLPVASGSYTGQLP
ncbi:MAG: rhodanese-like domain-containing protein [Thioalkalivibrionaceae bacterium]